MAKGVKIECIHLVCTSVPFLSNWTCSLYAGEAVVAL